jgi:hypothetical protein
VAITVSLLVSILFVGLRIYVRWAIIGRVGSDDQVLAATLVQHPVLLPSRLLTGPQVVHIAVSAIVAGSMSCPQTFAIGIWT